MTKCILAAALLSLGASGLADVTLREKIAQTQTNVAEDVWYGHARIKFDFMGRKAWVVQPSVAPAEGMPWTWTMQWATAFVDRTGVPDLLKRGFHHATIALYDTRMNDEGVEIAAEFQKFLVEKLGFAPKANLIGMSWGGFFSTRYAAAHPENVRKIYYDAPLMNFHGFYPDDSATERPDRIGSWAAALGKGESWMDDPRMPINLAGRIAAAKIPVLLLYGGQDQTVPPLLNCEVFAARFKAAGGDIVVRKRGMFGHHPHGLDPNKTQTIVDFFTK